MNKSILEIILYIGLEVVRAEGLENTAESFQ